MNPGDWGWHTQNELSARVKVVPVIFTSDKTHLTNFASVQYARPLDLTNGNIRKDFRQTPKKCAWILVGLFPHRPKGFQNTDEAWHSAVVTALSTLQNVDISSFGLKYNSADGFQRQCYPLLAAWVGDHPEHIMIAEISHCTCLKCGIPECVRMGHSACRALNNSRHHHVHPEQLEEPSIDVLHTL